MNNKNNYYLTFLFITLKVQDVYNSFSKSFPFTFFAILFLEVPTCAEYSLIFPYGHLYNTDTSLLRTVHLVPEKPKIINSLPL